MRKVIIGAAGGISALLTMASAVYASGYTYYSDLSELSNASGAASAFGTAALVSMLVPCCIILGVIVLDVVLAIIVYKDSQKNHVENGALWAILTFFFNVIGLLVYYLAIKPEAVKKHEGAGKTESKGGDDK